VVAPEVADRVADAVASSEPRPRPRSSAEDEAVEPDVAEDDAEVAALVAVLADVGLDAVGLEVAESSTVLVADADGVVLMSSAPWPLEANATPSIAGTMATPAARLMRIVRFMMTPWKWWGSCS